MPFVAQTERLCLRSWTESDRDSYARYCNRPRVMKYLGGVQIAQDLKADIEWFMECERVYGHTLWVIERKGDNAFLGFTGLDKLLMGSGEIPQHLHGEVEIGWRLREDAWGRGYASEAARISLDIAFRIRRIPRIVARVDRRNAASVRILSKLKLARDRSLEIGDGLHVHVIDRMAWFAYSDRGY